MEKTGTAFPANSVVQNFYIVMPGQHTPDTVSAERAGSILSAIKSAVEGAAMLTPKPPTSRETFSEVAQEWFNNNVSTWAPSYALRLRNRLETGLLQRLGDRPFLAVTAPDVLEVIRLIEARDARETARRVLRIASAIFRYAISTSRCERDPTIDLKGALKPARFVKHRSYISQNELPRFLGRLESYQGEMTKLAMKLLVLTFVRTNELRFAEWSEFEALDGENAVWRIPAARMKMRRPHLVPLSRQARQAVLNVRDIGNGSQLLFPANTKRGVISENTMLFALYRMGYKRRATVHGFRSLASTVLNEAQFNRDWIEVQLAHADHTVRGFYNAAEWLPGRRQMLQWWADHLDEIIRR